MLKKNEILNNFDTSLLPKDNFNLKDQIKEAVKKIEIPLEIEDSDQFIAIVYLLIFRYTNRNFFPLLIRKREKILFREMKIDDVSFYEYLKNLRLCNQYELEEEEVFKFPIIFEIVEDYQKVTTKLEVTDFKFLINKDNSYLIYNSNHYTETTINRFVENFFFFQKQLFENPERHIYDFEIVSKAEEDMIKSFNFKPKKYYAGETLIGEFYKIVEKNRNKYVAIYDEKKLTYDELNNLTNIYAEYLFQQDSNYIGLFMHDDISTYIGCLSILKAGKCIVTINPTYPKERIEQIISQLNLQLILTCEYMEDKIKDCKCKYIICKYDEKNKICKKKNIYNRKKLDECYVIFTSGTTGIPKGVIITEKNIMTEINYLEERCSFEENSKTLHILNYSFDFGLYDILSNIIKGRCLCSLDKKKIKSFKEYIDFIDKLEIQNINTTPSFFNILASFRKVMPSLKYVHLGGEKVTYEMVKKYDRVLDTYCDLYNGYGPCETTVGNALHLITPEERRGEYNRLKSVPIGSPTDESELFVLDTNEKFVPINCVGELYIGGECLGKGYVDKKQNENKFIYINNKLLYRTGDLVRWLENGEIEFVTREDGQIKKNGFRIELSEIDNVIMKKEQIIECTSVFENNRQMIISYVVSKNKIDENEIKKFVKKFLPIYMVPSRIIEIKKMPMLESGKVNVMELKQMSVLV